MRFIEVTDKTKLRLETLDLSLFWYTDKDNNLYISANPFVRELCKVCFKKASAICRASKIHTSFSYMLIGDHMIDLLCVNDKEHIQYIMDFLLDDRGWWKKKQDVHKELFEVRDIVRSALIDGSEAEVEGEVVEECSDTEKHEETSDQPEGAIFMTRSLIEKLDEKEAKRGSPWATIDAGKASNEV